MTYFLETHGLSLPAFAALLVISGSVLVASSFRRKG